jgi:hypothetical protein
MPYYEYSGRNSEGRRGDDSSNFMIGNGNFNSFETEENTGDVLTLILNELVDKVCNDSGTGNSPGEHQQGFRRGVIYIICHFVDLEN